MSEAAIYDALSEIFRDVFMVDHFELSPQKSAKDVPVWDSMKHIEIIMAVEERFSFNFSTKELDSLQTVGDLVKLIQSKA